MMWFTAQLPKHLEQPRADESESPGEERNKEVMQVHGELKMPLPPHRGP